MSLKDFVFVYISTFRDYIVLFLSSWFFIWSCYSLAFISDMFFDCNYILSLMLLILASWSTVKAVNFFYISTSLNRVSWSILLTLSLSILFYASIFFAKSAIYLACKAALSSISNLVLFIYSFCEAYSLLAVFVIIDSISLRELAYLSFCCISLICSFFSITPILSSIYFLVLRRFYSHRRF